MNLSKKSNIERDKSAKAQIRNIYVPEHIADPHKFTRNTQLAFEKIINKFAVTKMSKKLPSDYLSTIKSIYRGRFVCRNANCFHVTVSDGLANRAIRFLDSLAKELGNRKFKIQFIQDDAGSFIVAIKDNEHISFHISEGYRYHPIKNDLRSELERSLFRNKEPIPTGKLTLTILARETHISNSWSDGKKLIEDALPTIINSFESLVLCQKQRRVDNALKDDRRREELSIFNEIESRRHAEKAVYDNAMQEAQTFNAHRELETYLNHLELNCLKEYGYLNDATQHWLSTARKIAESQSPTSKRLKILGNFHI
ncbi:hypothetical protein GALL_269760 [mine drainage metagenome]|uniref:Uncharacterized protein n=1 Tax=mine drainage metagenome TaxID=410659 RepID=A0A1J5RNP4_9ZZZZ